MEEDFGMEIAKLVSLFKEAVKGGGSVYWDSDDLALVFLACMDMADEVTARKALGQLETDFPDSTITHVSKMKWLLYKRDFTGAYSELKRVDIEEFRNDFPDDLPFASECACEAGFAKEGIAYFLEYVDACSNYDETFLQRYVSSLIMFGILADDDELVESLIDTVTNVCKQVDVTLCSADALVLIDKTDKCIELLTELADREPLNPDVWKKLAFVYGKIDNREKMVECFDYFSALTNGDESFEILVMKVDILIAKSEFEEALEILYRCKKNKRKIHQYDDDVANLAFAKVYAQMKDFKREKQYLLKVMDFRKDECKQLWLSLVCDFCDDCDDKMEVVAFLTRAIYCCPSVKSLLMIKAANEFELYNETDKRSYLLDAKFDILRYLDYEPTSHPALAMMGKICICQNFYDESIIYLRKAYKADPQSDDVSLLLATAYYLNDNKIKFKRMFREYMSRDSEAKERFLKIFPNSKDIIDKI